MKSARTNLFHATAPIACVLASTVLASGEEPAAQWSGFHAGVHAAAALADYEFASRFAEAEAGALGTDVAAGGVQAGYD